MRPGQRRVQALANNENEEPGMSTVIVEHRTRPATTYPIPGRARWAAAALLVTGAVLEPTRRLAGRTSVLVLTMFDDDESVLAAMRAAGEAVFGADVAARVLGAFADDRHGGTVRPFPMLTDREREILGMIGAGWSNTDIARRLVLSDKTVRNHVSNIFAKLQVADRAQAIVRAREAGLGVSPPDR
jgi:DNA-binding NarL/FixJ family response regulator